MAQKWFHLIGVCGKTTANIAKVFQEIGWFVTGSDNQYLPPASLLLEKYNINTVEGYSFRHLTKDFWEEKLGRELDINENPDLVLFISHLNTKNKEYLFARKKNLDIRPYSKILGEYLIKPESIVVVGSAGKTTTTALTTLFLQKLGVDPSYMIGAEVIDIPDSLKITNSEFSVMEGDEYHNPDPQIEGKAKFLEYKPKYLIITNIGWEHQDIFPTQERYIEEFAKAVELIPEDGLIVAHLGDENIDKALKNAKARVIRYGLKPNSKLLKGHEEFWSVDKRPDGISGIYDSKGNLIFEFETKLLGEYNLENILASVITVLNLPAKKLLLNLFQSGTESLNILKDVIKDFEGPKKRLEKLYISENLIVVDDFGVTPNRAKNSLKTLKEYYPEFNIVAVFEPNSASRPKDEALFSEMYKGSFKNAERVIIPDLSTVNEELAQSDEMVDRLRNLGFNSEHISNSDLVDNLKKFNEMKKKTLIVFFSSYRLTEIAEELVKELA